MCQEFVEAVSVRYKADGINLRETLLLVKQRVFVHGFNNEPAGSVPIGIDDEKNN